MKKFIFNLIAFAVVFFTIAFFLDKIITIGLRQNETKHFHNLSKIHEGNVNADVIINGSSKALVQVDPFIIDSILEVNSYNLGLDGTPFIPQMAQYEIYKINNTKPKIIIQIVSNGTLRSLQEGFNLPFKFAPYLNIPEVKNLMKLTSSFNYLDYSLPMFRYSGQPFEIIIGGLSYFDIHFLKTKNTKGYEPDDSSWPESIIDGTNNLENTQPTSTFNNSQNIEIFTSLDKISCENFERFLSQCESENIVVFLVYPPIYEEDFNTIKHINYYEKVAHKYNAYFLNYSQDSLLAFDKKYFYNSQHLNLKGATIFTTKVSEAIKASMHNDSITY